MSSILEDLAYRLNIHTTAEGTTFDAVVADNDILEVTCSNNEEFPIHIARTETQLLAVTPLFQLGEVQQGRHDELNKTMLQLSPAVPLSAIGLQGKTYILFGAMALDTMFENVVHELEVQAENTIDVLEVVQPLLS